MTFSQALDFWPEMTKGHKNLQTAANRPNKLSCDYVQIIVIDCVFKCVGCLQQ